MYTNLKISDVLYLIPGVGAINHARDLGQLNAEHTELKKIIPQMDNLDLPISSKTLNKVEKAIKSLDTLKHVDKIKASDYFSRKYTVQKMAKSTITLRGIIGAVFSITYPIFLLAFGADMYDLSLVVRHSFLKHNFCYRYDPITKKSVFHHSDLVRLAQHLNYKL